MRRWTPLEEELLRKHFHTNIEYLVKRLSRPQGEIRTKAWRMGMYRKSNLPATLTERNMQFVIETADSKGISVSDVINDCIDRTRLRQEAKRGNN